MPPKPIPVTESAGDDGQQMALDKITFEKDMIQKELGMLSLAILSNPPNHK